MAAALIAVSPVGACMSPTMQAVTTAADSPDGGQRLYRGGVKVHDQPDLILNPLVDISPSGEEAWAIEMTLVSRDGMMHFPLRLRIDADRHSIQWQAEDCQDRATQAKRNSMVNHTAIEDKWTCPVKRKDIVRMANAAVIEVVVSGQNADIEASFGTAQLDAYRSLLETAGHGDLLDDVDREDSRRWE